MEEEPDERYYRASFSAVIVGHGSFQSTSQTDTNIKLLPAISSEINNIYYNIYYKEYIKKPNPTKPTKMAYIQYDDTFTITQKPTSSPIDISKYKKNFIKKVKESYFIRSCPQEYICINRKDIELGPSDLALKEAFFKGIQRNMNVESLQNCLRLLEIFFIANQFNVARTILPFDLDTLIFYLTEDVPQEKIKYLKTVYSRINLIYSDFDNIYNSLTQLFLDTSFQSKLIKKREMLIKFIQLFLVIKLDEVDDEMNNEMDDEVYDEMDDEVDDEMDDEVDDKMDDEVYDEMDNIACAKFQEFNPSENTQLKTYFFHENEYDGLYLYDIESNYKIHIHSKMTQHELRVFRQIAHEIYSRNKSEYSKYYEFELFLLNYLIDLIADNTKYNTEIISSQSVTMLLTLLNIRNVSLDLTCSILGKNEGFDARKYMKKDNGFGVRKTKKNKNKRNLKKKTVNKQKQKKTKKRKPIYA
jgi:hypothetical protein